MTLTDAYYLEIEGDSADATFELREKPQMSSGIARSYLMGERGQYIRQIVNQVTGIKFDEELRTGYWVDGGAGEWTVSVDFEGDLQDLQWGDGSGGTGGSNVTETDASGADVRPISRLQVMQYWITRTRMDSTGAARLHWGEWTDGDIQKIDSSGISAGVYSQPMPVTIRETRFDGPDPERGSNSFSGTLEMNHVALWGGDNAPDWVSNLLTGATKDASEALPDF